MKRSAFDSEVQLSIAVVAGQVRGDREWAARILAEVEVGAPAREVPAVPFWAQRHFAILSPPRSAGR